MTSPAAVFLDQLAAGTWVEDPDSTDFPDDAQIDDCDKVIAWCQMLADDGVPPYRGSVNDLDDGIWEFKVGSKRLSFFDTPGDGTYTPKLRIDDFSLADCTDEFWWFPQFDPHVRLGHAFPKLGQRTRPGDIETTLKVREEDVTHDRTY